MSILNEREYKLAKSRLERLTASLQMPTLWDAVKVGFSSDTIDRQRSALNVKVEKLRAEIHDYEQLRDKKPEQGTLETNDLGLIPIIGRIARGLSQRQLAARLGMKEQQVQRYEAERYRSIKLSTYQQILLDLKISLSAKLDPSEVDMALDEEKGDPELPQISKEALKEISERGWLTESGSSQSPAQVGTLEIKKYVRDRIKLSSGPVFLRGTIRGRDVDLGALQAWRARIIDIVQQRRAPKREFDYVDLSWIKDLVRLSALSDGPLKAAQLIENRGIKFVVERHLPRTHIDGAAFSLEGQPIIALSLRFDRVDSFWFTLLHEIGHVFLHHSSGLEDGFFDDMTSDEKSQVENEADEFSSEALIPKGLWDASPARFAKSVEPMRTFARSIGVHEAIVVGRVRHERKYSLFGEFVGQGEVRRLFPQGSRNA